MSKDNNFFNRVSIHREAEALIFQGWPQTYILVLTIVNKVFGLIYYFLRAESVVHSLTYNNTVKSNKYLSSVCPPPQYHLYHCQVLLLASLLSLHFTYRLTKIIPNSC